MSEPREGAAAVGVEATYGCQSMTAKLRRVLLRNPDEASCDLWGDYGWRAAPNFAQLLREQEGLCELLASSGAEVVFGEQVPGGLDAIYTFDPAIVSRRGAIVLRPGKELRSVGLGGPTSELGEERLEFARTNAVGLREIGLSVEAFFLANDFIELGLSEDRSL